MRILNLTPHLPHAPGGGGATRQFHLLERLVELGHDVTVVVPVPQRERELVAIPRAAGIRVEVVERPPSRVAETAGVLRAHPGLVPLAAIAPLHAWQLRVLWRSMLPSVRATLAGAPPDLITVEHDVSGGWIADLPSDVPALLSLHNVTADYYAARAAATHGARRGWFGVEARRARIDARRWLPRYRALVCVSDADAQSVERLLPAGAPRPATVPNGVDLDAFPPVAAEPAGPPTLLFTGTMNYAPNVEGIRWFADAVWPAVRAARPDARLVVVGRDPTESVRRLGELAGVTVTGAVPEVAPYFADAHVVIVPLLSGGGTRLKILEAASSGRPIVSTRRGAEGLDVRHGRELLLADDPDAFARETLALLDDDAHRVRLGVAARSLAERHDWRALGDALERVALDAVGRADAQRASSSR